MVIFVIAAFLIVFPLFWCGVIFLISAFGWRQLAAKYATHQPMPKDMKLGSGMLNMARYNGTLLFKADDRGLWIKTLRLFSPGHRPLFIPWSAVQEYNNSDSFWFYRTKFVAAGVTVRLNMDLDPWLKGGSEFV